MVSEVIHPDPVEIDPKVPFGSGQNASKFQAICPDPWSQEAIHTSYTVRILFGRMELLFSESRPFRTLCRPGEDYLKQTWIPVSALWCLNAIKIKIKQVVKPQRLIESTMSY